MEICGAESKDLGRARCESCGRPLDLWCEDCGCPVSCHDFIYPKAGERLPYCLWDFGPCPREQRPAFFGEIEAWLGEMGQHLPPVGSMKHAA